MKNLTVNQIKALPIKNQVECLYDLSEGDDSWGFEKMPTLKLSTTEKVVYGIIIGFVSWYILQALIYII